MSFPLVLGIEISFLAVAGRHVPLQIVKYEVRQLQVEMQHAVQRQSPDASALLLPELVAAVVAAAAI